MRVSAQALQRPWVSLAAVFFAWKALLLLVAAVAPGPGYDTSTQILFYGLNRTDHDWPAADAVVAKLVRWDAIYFTSGARDGNVFEQEWAFSGAMKRLISSVARVALGEGPHSFVPYALAGVLVSHLAHLLTVVALYRLVHAIVYDEREADQLAFVTAVLHVISPAGLFLSAPYAESVFALLNVVGMLQYALAMQHEAGYVKTRILVSGVAFGLATLVRSNGLLSGVIYAVDVFSLQLNMIGRPVTSADSRLLLAKYVAGAFVGLGFVLPQVVAYGQYCTGKNTRPWCERLVPSIYNWVQSHYWGVGFLRYWTISNIPLFLLAAPTLALMLATACSVHLPHFSYLTRRRSLAQQRRAARPGERVREREGNRDRDRDRDGPATRKRGPQRYANSTIRRLALPQGLLAVLAFTHFHVQIATRLSSGYPVWHFLLARAVVERRTWFGWVQPRWVVRWMAVYALVQGALYASFLPPA